VVRVATGAEVAQKGDATDVHLPSPSYWPLVTAAGLPIIAYGLIFNLGLAALGALIVVIGGFGWGYEPADDPEAHHGPHGHDGHDDGPDGAEAALPAEEAAEADAGDGESSATSGEPAPAGASATTASASDEEAPSDD
jgi:cytochrome c oxidase subunit I